MPPRRPVRGCRGGMVTLLLDDREDVAGGEYEVLLTGVLDLGAAVLGVDHRVADLHVDRNAVALVVDTTGAHSEDSALLRLLLGGVGDHQARCRGGLSLVRLDHDAVLKRLDRNLGRGSHGHTLLGYWISAYLVRTLAAPSSRVPAPPGVPTGRRPVS